MSFEVAITFFIALFIFGITLGPSVFAILKEDLARNGLNLQTPLNRNMNGTRSKAYVTELMRDRRLVEAVIGQLID
jgi:hypothetical protein